MSKRDPDARVARILTAAIAEFARHGPEGARIDAIAAGAGMNKRLLYHYLGAKETLFGAALTAGMVRMEATTAPSGAESDQQAWRLLCHASAVGQLPDLDGLVEHLRGASSRDGAIVLTALKLLEATLPELVDGLIGSDSGEREDRLQKLPSRVETALDGPHPAKPRVRLQPELRPV